MLDASEYYVYFPRTVGAVFFLQRGKETPREFLIALQFDCFQIIALMLPVIRREGKNDGVQFW